MIYWYMIGAIVVGSAASLLGGATIFLTKRRRTYAILMALPFGAGALLAATFFDLLPEAFELGEPQELLVWMLMGFLVFFMLERSVGWFHHHHEHDSSSSHGAQGTLVIIGDLLHNIIDGIAIGTAFLVNPASGLVTTLAVSAHEIPKEIGTFGMLLSRGWREAHVLRANVITAIGTLVAASVTFWLGSSTALPVGPLLAVTSGFFVYIAASDIIPDIHEQPQRIGTIQAIVLVLGVVCVGAVVYILGV